MRRALTFIFLSCMLFFFANASIAKEITILYTGDTHGMVYHCNCPMEPDGGVSRRATLIKELKTENPQALLLDSGGFFAGGLMDEYTQNTDLDKQRTLVNLKAMEVMKYDAVAIGDDEFNFGKEFFRENIDKTKLSFLSCNLKADRISPYIIKEVSGIKIGIIGVSNLAATQKAGGIEIARPKAAVELAVREARNNGANIIVLLSRLGESDDLNLINEVKGIDVVIIGKSRAKEESSSKAGDVLILRPAWQGRKLGKAVISVEDNKVSDYKVEELRLSDKISDDADILAILPKCFSEANCKKEGFIGTCDNPGAFSASCSFKAAEKIKLLVITSRDCIACGAENTVDSLKRQFPGLAVSYLYYPEKKAKDLVSQLEISSLPVFLFDKSIEKEKDFESLRSKTEAKKDYYMLMPQFGGMAYFLNREKISAKFDLFISLFNKESSNVLEAVAEFNPAVHFLAVEQPGYFDASGGRLEVEECLRSVCVQKYYPEYFREYISCRAKNINSSWWEDCLTKYNSDRIRACARSQEGLLLLKENISLNKDLQVMFGPAYLVDNQQIFATQGVPSKEELRKIIKR